MMVHKISDLSKLCIHTMTTRPWGISECVKNYSAIGVHNISIWRNVLENKKLSDVRILLNDSGMKVISICRGGFFASADKLRREQSLQDNLNAIEQAVALNAQLIILVCGADKMQSLQTSREQISEGIIRILPAAQKAGIKLAIEPLHPVYAGDRSAINTMKQANDLVEMINSQWLGVAVDVYHTWWDEALHSEINRCAARNRLFSFHISDWKVPTADVLNDRGLMGEGCINIREIRGWVEETGFSGPNEVEIFSDIYWSLEQHNYLQMIKEAYLKYA